MSPMEERIGRSSRALNLVSSLLSSKAQQKGVKTELSIPKKLSNEGTILMGNANKILPSSIDRRESGGCGGRGNGSMPQNCRSRAVMDNKLKSKWDSKKDTVFMG